MDRAPEPKPGFEDPRSRRYVGHHQYLAQVLRVNHLGAPWHLEHHLRQGGPHSYVAGAEARADDGPLLLAQDDVVGDGAGMGVELAALFQRNQVTAPFGIEQQGPFAGLEGPVAELAGLGAAGSWLPGPVWLGSGWLARGSLGSGLAGPGLAGPGDHGVLIGRRRRCSPVARSTRRQKAQICAAVVGAPHFEQAWRPSRLCSPASLTRAAALSRKPL